MPRFSALLLALAVLLTPSVALAYGGPGAGISAIGSLLSLVAAAGLAILGFIWYPIRRLLRSRNRKEPKTSE